MIIKFDDFNKIKFVRHGGKYGKQLGLWMPGHYWVPREDVLFAWDNATKRLFMLDFSQDKVVSKLFFDQDEWSALLNGKKLALGRCIKYFSTHEMLPIEVANPGKKGSRIYKKGKNWPRNLIEPQATKRTSPKLPAMLKQTTTPTNPPHFVGKMGLKG